MRRREADLGFSPSPCGRGAGGGGGGLAVAPSPQPPPAREGGKFNSPASELCEQPNMRADTVVEAALLELFVRTVDLVVIKPEAHQQAVDAQYCTQRGHHRDRTAAAHQYCFLAVFVGQHRLRRAYPRAFDI